ncbi:hypothetical protein EDB81DRAFT_877138 [Dactylonectria macrodidyma]|uniref:Telomerase reverse transcriptase n=1 Tax=Dactylonectria macrodidyma TaxID=307937 RepID=A0A9P9FPG4_9HYPO|nr:hypothetical protein EDB81DRAFT_877138 [Dactylonectria macrodidyma]
MASKRKRKYSCNDASKCKKQRITGGDTPVRRDLLERSYARVTTLREHILSNLPGSSRLRRKKIASLGHNEGAAEIESQLAHLLDTSLVCAHQPEVHHQETRWEQWLSFSQKGDESHVTLANGLSGSIYSQSEVVDFVIWLLFSRESKVGKRPKHLLCDGFRRGTGSGGQAGVVIPGLFSLYPNSNVKAIKEAPWPQLLVLLGRSGEKMMIDLLVDCAIYVTVQAGIHNYEQRSGIPLSEIDLPQSSTSVGNVESAQCRKPAEITLHPQANPATAESRIAPKKQFRKTQPGTQVSPLPQYKNLVEIATPPSQVSAFCQAALLKIIPSQFWGDGDTQIHNKLKIRQKIEHFVKLRRFESMSLHEISQDLKVRQYHGYFHSLPVTDFEIL